MYSLPNLHVACLLIIQKATHDFLPTLTEYDIQRAAEVS